MDFRGFLNDQKVKSNTNKLGSARNVGKVNEDNGRPRKIPATESKNKESVISDMSVNDLSKKYSYLNYSDSVGGLSEDTPPDAASEKELGNEHFKQKKFLEATACYSRSIALSPTAVAFANRAMAYLKLKRFEEAENDCTEALNLDDRYVKAYSRRSTARKELGKLKEATYDADFAVRLEPNNPELRKQYTDTKALYEKELSKKSSGALKPFAVENQRAEISTIASRSIQDNHSTSVNTQSTATVSTSKTVKKQEGTGHKNDPKTSMQELATRAASLMMSTTARNITIPKSAYEFEVSWRALSDDCASQVQLLKMIPPANLPQIFKNALSAPILIEIIRCIGTFFLEDIPLAISILDNMAKVPRFDMLIMCLSAKDRAEVRNIWNDIFSYSGVSAKDKEALSYLRSKYCYGEWQDHILESNGWPKEM